MLDAGRSRFRYVYPAVEGYSGAAEGPVGLDARLETGHQGAPRGKVKRLDGEGDEIFACSSRLTETLGKFILGQ